MGTQPSSQPENAKRPACPARRWQVIATELSEEHDSDKITALSEELNRALDRWPTRE